MLTRNLKAVVGMAAVVAGTMVFGTVISWSTASDAATLDKIRQSGSIKLGIRNDAAPFSYLDQSGKPAGYSVSLCEAVAGALRDSLKLQDLSIDYVSVSAEDRFKALGDGRIDLLCGATTLTLSRRETVDFSVKTFVTGASVLYRAGGPASFSELNGQKVGVRAGTTTDDNLKKALNDAGIQAEVVPVKNHNAGRDALESGLIAAYFADRAILVMLARQSAKPELLVISGRFFSYEPYALALRYGDSDFRLAVDRALVRLYRSPAIREIYKAHFGQARMSDLLRAMYTLQSLQE